MHRLTVIDDVHCVLSTGEVPVNGQGRVGTTVQFCCIVYSRHAASSIDRQFTVRRYNNVDMHSILTALCDILYKRLRNTLTYLLTYLLHHTRGALKIQYLKLEDLQYGWRTWSCISRQLTTNSSRV